jgi:hypothetical protein
MPQNYNQGGTKQDNGNHFPDQGKYLCAYPGSGSFFHSAGIPGQKLICHPIGNIDKDQDTYDKDHARDNKLGTVRNRKTVNRQIEPGGYRQKFNWWGYPQRMRSSANAGKTCNPQYPFDKSAHQSGQSQKRTTISMANEFLVRLESYRSDQIKEKS